MKSVIKEDLRPWEVWISKIGTDKKCCINRGHMLKLVQNYISSVMLPVVLGLDHHCFHIIWTVKCPGSYTRKTAGG